jgi:ABC-type transport system involved in multi-copper enzyme maturation permease subunit
MVEPLPQNWDEAVRWFLGGTVVFALGFEGVTMALGAQFLLSGLSFLIAMGLLAFMVYWPPGGSLILVMVGAALLSFLGAMEIGKRFQLTGSRKMLTLGIVLMIIAVICAGIGGAVIYIGAIKGPVAGVSEGATTTQMTTSTAPAPIDHGVFAQSASLQILIRPNQDPLEISRENVWRWFVFKIANQNPQTHEIFPIGTYIFLTFDRPVQTGYRRVFSPSNPDLRFDVLDLTARSMVIAISNVDITGATVEVHVSGTPL